MKLHPKVAQLFEQSIKSHTEDLKVTVSLIDRVLEDSALIAVFSPKELDILEQGLSLLEWDKKEDIEALESQLDTSQ